MPTMPHMLRGPRAYDFDDRCVLDICNSPTSGKPGKSELPHLLRPLVERMHARFRDRLQPAGELADVRQQVRAPPPVYAIELDELSQQHEYRDHDRPTHETEGHPEQPVDHDTQTGM